MSLRHELRLFLIALQFFTRVPIPRWVGFEPQWLQDCTRYFPWVGACVGLWGALLLWLGATLWTPTVAAVLSVAATVWLTGAFHEDGWADTCDGLGGAVSRERALTIMKDSRIGAYGAIGLVLMLSLKLAALSSLAQQDLTLALLATLWAHTASRVAPVWLIRSLAYAGDVEHAKAKPLSTQVSRGGLGFALLSVLALSAALLTWQPALWVAFSVAAVLALLATVQMRRWLQQRLGGYTGDTLGATQQLSEAAALLGFLAVALHA